MRLGIEEQLAAARRELERRRRCYPLWVRQGRISRERAAQEIAAMESIVATLAGLAPHPSLATPERE